MNPFSPKPGPAQPKRPPLDINRVGRGTTLIAKRLGPGEFVVTGDEEPHYVTLEPYYTCDCGDFLWRGAESVSQEYYEDPLTGERKEYILCKHICSALIQIGDPEALDLMMQWYEREKVREAERAAVREVRRKEREARAAERQAKLQAEIEKRKAQNGG